MFRLASKLGKAWDVASTVLKTLSAIVVVIGFLAAACWLSWRVGGYILLVPAAFLSLWAAFAMLNDIVLAICFCLWDGRW